MIVMCMVDAEQMSSWNVMAVTDVEADIKQLLGQSGLLFS